MGIVNTNTAPILLPQIPQELDENLKMYLAALQLALFRYLTESARSEIGEDVSDAVTSGASGSMNFLGFAISSGSTAVGTAYTTVATKTVTSTKAHLIAWGGVGNYWDASSGDAGPLGITCRIAEGAAIMGSETTMYDISTELDSGAQTKIAIPSNAGGELRDQTIGSKTFNLQVKRSLDSGALNVTANQAWLMAAEYG